MDMDRDRMITENQGLVHWMARKYRWSGVSHEDLAQQGYLGLMKAAERFDPTRGVKFSTYATWWIRQRIQRLVNKRDQSLSLDDYVGDGETRHVDQVAGPDDVEATVTDRMTDSPARLVIASMSPREERVMRMRLSLGRQSGSSLEEVASPFEDLRSLLEDGAASRGRGGKKLTKWLG